MSCMPGIWSSVRGRRRLLIFIGVVLLIFSGNLVSIFVDEKRVISRCALAITDETTNDETAIIKLLTGTRDKSQRPYVTSGSKKSEHGALRNLKTNFSLQTKDDSNFRPSVVRVAFFEGFRGNSWIFERYFQPFYSEVRCQCSSDVSDVVTKQMVNKRYETKGFDIVIFPYDVTVLRGDKLFWERLQALRKDYRPTQRWVYATRECPIKLQRTLIPTRFSKNSFHWSSTYRSKSDFPSPYGSYQRYEELRNESVGINWATQKSAFIAWMSSNNQTTWYRQRFVQAINSHLEIDIYGKTGQSCGRNSTECEDKIKSYKFYLALENSCCEEYISEKFWRTLTWDTVPIVIGPSKTDYDRVAPPNSFIYADDFESMDDFVSYLRDVDTNDTLYNSFFKWKETGFVINSFPDAGKDDSDAKSDPPDQLYYSCSKVCDMSRKYRQENEADGAPRHRFFNPRSGYWTGSCGSCANHTWIKQFQKVVIN